MTRKVRVSILESSSLYTLDDSAIRSVVGYTSLATPDVGSTGGGWLVEFGTFHRKETFKKNKNMERDVRVVSRALVSGPLHIDEQTVIRAPKSQPIKM